MSSEPTHDHLTPRQLNEVTDLVAASGLPPYEFEWRYAWRREHDGKWKFDQPERAAISFYERGCALMFGRFYFAFVARDNHTFKLSFSPADTTVRLDGEVIHFTYLAQTLAQWLQFLSWEQVEDKWRAFAEGGRLFDLNPDDNRPLSGDEQRLLEARLAELEEKITAQPELTPEQQERVHGKFRYLRDAMTRLGRFDWLSALQGKLFEMALERMLTPQFWTHTVLPFFMNMLVGPITLPPPR